MKFNDYCDVIWSDACEWIDENSSYYDNVDEMIDECRLCVTGNDNGSYYCNAARAKREASEVEDYIMDDIVQSYGGEFVASLLLHDWEGMDVVIRDYAFGYKLGEIEEYASQSLEQD